MTELDKAVNYGMGLGFTGMGVLTAAVGIGLALPVLTVAAKVCLIVGSVSALFGAIVLAVTYCRSSMSCCKPICLCDDEEAEQEKYRQMHNAADDAMINGQTVHRAIEALGNLGLAGDL